MDNRLDLSFIVCTRNRCAKLPAILQRFATLKTRHAWEVLFVDNASTDATAEIIKTADDCGGRLRYLRVDRIGLGAARDAAWRQANGRIIAFTDDDCYPAEDYADALVEVYRQHPDAGCISGRVLLYDPTDAPMTINERTMPATIPPYHFIGTGMFQGANISFRRAVLEDIGGFDPEFGAGTPFPCEDIDAVAAALWSGTTARYDPAPVIWHHHGRKHADLKPVVDGYDRGRGAYYAKFLLRPESRRAYLRGWWDAVMRHPYGIYGIDVFTRELGSAFVYLRHRKANAFILAAAPLAISLYIYVIGRLSLRILNQRLHHFAHKVLA
jgi:glycosyltransferase involved in cell wall biosynthesis